MTPPQVARRLFPPIAPTYERWARVFGFGQDGRWRETMVAGLGAPPGSLVLDVAAGTGSITRALERRGHRVMALDQSPEMLARLGDPPLPAVVATAELLPFPAETFDAVTFGYLLRYVDDVAGCLRELARVTRPGGRVGMVEFGRPRSGWWPLWAAYTRGILPLAGRAVGSGWDEVGRFLGGSIEGFAARWPPDRLAEAWEAAGMVDVVGRRMSLGGGLVMWGTRA